MTTKVKRYIPVLVYNEIQNLEFKNKEHLYIICDMINRISIFKKEDTNYSNNFIDIPKYYFRDIIDSSVYLGNAITILKENKIIICDGFYSKNSGKALGYRFDDKYISKLIEVEINSKPLSKKIINNKNTRNNLVADTYKPAKDYFLNTFSINYEGALRYIDSWYDDSILSLNTLLCGEFLNKEYHKEWIKVVNKYNYLKMSICAINDGYLFFKKNQTNGRIDTNLTSLKGELKQFIVKENLWQIDIINSQPFILTLLLNSLLCGENLIEKKELIRYTEWTSAGIFYERFETEYFNKTSKVLNRKEIKNIMFCIFYSKNTSYIKEKNIFKTMFPTIMKWIDEQKKDKHNEFAIKLQKIESKICIDIICTELNKANINYYTIHDAWLVDEKDVKETEKIIYRMFYKHFYRRPELKTDKINK
jgi:hypothetical protein